jgi:hypothetical protein
VGILYLGAIFFYNYISAMSSAQPPDTILPEDNGNADVAKEIESVINTATQTSKGLESAYIEMSANTDAYLENTRKRVLEAKNSYRALVHVAKMLATDVRVKALEKFSDIAVHYGQSKDSEIADSFDYIINHSIPKQQKKLATDDGKTFASVQDELNNIAATISKESAAKIKKADSKVTLAQEKLNDAEEELKKSQEKYDQKVPGWLRSLGLDEDSPKELFMLVVAPFTFLKERGPGGHQGSTYLSEIRELLDEIKLNKQNVEGNRQKLATALKELEVREEEGNIIQGGISRLKSLSVDMAGAGAQLEIFQKVYDMVKGDMQIYSAYLKGEVPLGRKPLSKKELGQEIQASDELFNKIAGGMSKFSLYS